MQNLKIKRKLKKKEHAEKMKKSDGFFRYSPSLTEGQGGGTTRQRHCGGWSVKNPTDFFGTHPLFCQRQKGGGRAG